MLMIGVAAALIAAVSWAISAAFYKTGAEDVSPLAANSIRILAPISILAIIALVLNLYPQVLLLSPWDWFLIITSSLFAFVIGDALYFVAIQKLGVSRGVPLTSTYPLFVLLFQILFLAQPIHWLMVPAALLTVSGITLLGYQLNKTIQAATLLTRSMILLGIIAAIGTALSWSISTIFLSAVLQNTNLILIAVIRLSIALVIMGPLIIGQQIVKPEKRINRQKLSYLSIGGIFALTIGYVGFAHALQLMDTTSVALLSSLTPLFAALIGWRSLQEKFDFKTLIAIIACVVGVILITFAVSFI
jgi:DME family drug/metabolite transporter